MRKKTEKKIPEQTTRPAPVRIKKDSLIASMRRLTSTPEYGLLRSLWLTKRGELLEAGKTKPSEAAWSVLKGFDDAIMAAESWAVRESDDTHSRQADDLQAALGGNTEGT